jgi:hypothetical protein
MKVVKYTGIVPQDVKFAEPVPMARGGYTVSLTAPDGAKIVFQTPRMKVPFGLSRFDDDKHSLCVSLEDTAFAGFLDHLDQHVLDTVTANYPQWFNKTYSRPVLKEYFSSNIRKDPLGKYGGTWRLPIPVYSGKCQTAFFDAAKVETTMEAAVKGSSVVCLVELTGLWFVNKRFGIKWKPIQVMVHPPDDRVTGFAFVEDEDT